VGGLSLQLGVSPEWGAGWVLYPGGLCFSPTTTPAAARCPWVKPGQGAVGDESGLLWQAPAVPPLWGLWP